MSPNKQKDTTPIMLLNNNQNNNKDKPNYPLAKHIRTIDRTLAPSSDNSLHWEWTAFCSSIFCYSFSVTIFQPDHILFFAEWELSYDV